jgi:hypothetical protein
VTAAPDVADAPPLRLAALDPRAVAREALEALLRQRAALDLTLAPARAAPDPAALIDALRTSNLVWATLLDAGHEPATGEALDTPTRRLVARACGLTWRAATELAVDALVDGSDLGLTLQALVTYARRGRAWDWTDAEMAADGLQTVCGLLWPLSSVLPLDEAPGALGVALRGVWTRVRIGRGHPIAQRHLAELAGVSDGRIRQLVAHRVLKRVRAAKGARSVDAGWITAASAGAWLAARDAAGD